MGKATPEVLKRMYYLAFGLILLGMTLGQGLIQWSLFLQQENSRVVNVAGRQRMLSQRISQLAFKMHLSENNSYIEDQLNQSFALLKASHRDLLAGNKKLDIKPAFNFSITKSLLSLSPLIKSMETPVKCFTEPYCEMGREVAVMKLFTATEDFLPQMDAVVLACQDYSKNQILLLGWLEFGIYIMIVCLMGFEIFRVFLPYNLLLSEQLKKISQQKQAIYEKTNMEAMGEMAGGLSHEINNPLAIISGSVIRLKGKHSDPKDLEALEFIESAASRISKIVFGMRCFSKPLEGVKESFTALEVVDVSLNLVRNEFAGDKIEVENLVSRGASELFLYGERAKVQQTLLVLLKNAREAAKESEKKKVVFQLNLGEGSHLEFRIRDFGAGVPEELESNVFEPFVTSKTNEDSLGLGLAIAYSYAKSLKGTITFRNVEPSEGGGAEFCFRVPASEKAILANADQLDQRAS